MPNDELFMQRALDLAVLGRGQVSPNPMVGCVIVHQGKVIGEGWHKKYGDWHAEVNAIESVEDKTRLPESTAYVTLEPCSHYGKTPPCADLLITHQLKRIVVGNFDSNPLVSGRGVEKLRQAGIVVTTNVLESQGRALNKRFFTYMEKKRPYIILKWAQTADGFIARPDYDSKWISNELSRKLVHRWRAEEDAVMVGTRTALYDNPRLNVRDWSGRNPLRIVIDKQLQIPRSHYLFDQLQRTLCYNAIKQETQESVEYVLLPESGELVPFVLQDLVHRGVQSFIVEGGSHLLSSFIQHHHWDEIRLFSSGKRFEQGIAAPTFVGIQTERITLYDDELRVFVPPYYPSDKAV